jgi:hypothetical protein
MNFLPGRAVVQEITGAEKFLSTFAWNSSKIPPGAVTNRAGGTDPGLAGG